MIKIYHSADDFFKNRKPFPDYLDAVADSVRSIIQSVRERGDAALKEFSVKFDNADLQTFRMNAEQIEKAKKALSPELQAIFLEAANNVREFHKKELPVSWLDESTDGTKLGQKYTPVERAGVYIPGGTAAYPSSVLMNVIPAQIAGVKEIVAISPPRSAGEIHPMVLASLALLGIDEIYALGGAHGIAALAYGTETIPRVFKITGPGNAYVMEAKRQVFGQVGIDSLAGPTELVVIADNSANPAFVARDMMAQAEHDPHAMTVLITNSADLAERVAAKLTQFTATAKRKEILKESLGNHGAAVFVNDLREAAAVSNEIAPEHLEIMTKSDEAVVEKITNAGAIFWGEYSSEPVGDYWAGPNHILPTNGTAKFSSPLGVMDFMKHSSLIHYSKERLMKHAVKIEKIARLEGLDNHSKSVEVRHE